MPRDKATPSSEALISELLASLEGYVALLDARGSVIFENAPGSAAALAQSLGATVKDDRGGNFIEVCRTRAGAGSLEAAAIAAALESICEGRSKHATFEYPSAEPRTARWFRITISERNGPDAGAVVVLREITDSKHDDDTLAMVGARLAAIHEDERRQLAHDLHGDISQRLALLSFDLQRLGQIVPAEQTAAAELVVALWERAAQIATSVHQLTYRLHPLKLELLGLSGAINDLRRQLSTQHAVTIGFTCDDVPESLPRHVALCLFRVAQEGLSNVIKHSGVASAHVEIRATSSEITLVISDDGAGFDPDAEGAGLGLAGIRQRLLLLGGKLRLRSTAGGGTRLEATVPYRAALPG